MSIVVSFENRVELPLNIGSLAEFRSWTYAPEFPTTGRIDFLPHRIEVDLSPEHLYCHGTLKTVIASVLHRLARATDMGDVFVDSTRVSCPAVNLSVEPDVVVVSPAAIESGRVVPISAAMATQDQYVELEGAPDLVVEVVSDSSVAKDLRRLPPLYYSAGINELWLADARSEELMFEIRTRGDAGFEPQPLDGEGFQHSPTFGRGFRLERTRHRLGHWQFDLVVR